MAFSNISPRTASSLLKTFSDISRNRKKPPVLTAKLIHKLLAWERNLLNDKYPKPIGEPSARRLNLQMFLPVRFS
jgi:hypothetical protein